MCRTTYLGNKKDTKKVVVVFLDIERAYDFVVPKKLCNILREFQFPLNIIEWIDKMLTDRELILKGRDFVIKKKISLGLPQGCKLSPVLFNLYTAGVHSVIGNNAKLFQFADDFAVLGKGNTVQQA